MSASGTQGGHNKVNERFSTGLGVKATHGDKTTHAACIETESTEHFDVVSTSRRTLSIKQITQTQLVQLALHNFSWRLLILF